MTGYSDSCECCNENERCCIEAVVSVDSRGQIVLPKEIRDRAGIETGDRLVLIGWEKDGEVCCLSLVKTDKITGMVADYLEPMMKNVTGRKNED
ncbi:HgcAB-associated protein HgcC [Methanolacinia paynteri]|uniref:HgcAB-associated protein HgcC n=1 Tax=Methanolacinia paynteri TaxID=230356 RepID=UPI00064F0E43|nr:HgcAB-associated protein [Methanolacinia paynteri]